ncbi:MAG: DUF4258 domain-containing protein [Candidatus Humimicrobiaceae bacterium]
MPIKDSSVKLVFHQHSILRMSERGVSLEEVQDAIVTGEKFMGKFERTGYRKNFVINGIWKDKRYNIKRVEVYTVLEDKNLIVVTVIAKYF